MRRIVSLLDLILFSASNFILMISISRIYGEVFLATIGVLISITLVIQGLQRSIYIVPVAVLAKRNFVKLHAAIIGEHACFLLISLFAGSIIILAASILSHLNFAENILIYSYVVLLFLQPDFERYVIAKQDPSYFSIVFSFLSCLFIGIAFTLGNHYGKSIFTLTHFILIILIPPFLRFFIFTIHAQACNIKYGLKKLFRDMRIRLSYSTFGVLSFAAYNHAPLMILSTTSGAKESAAFVAMRSLVQPIQILIRTFDFKDKADFAQASNLRQVFIATIKRNTIFSLGMVLCYALIGHYLILFTYGVKYTDQIYTMITYAFIFVCMSVLLPIENIINMRSIFSGHSNWRIISVFAGIGGGLVLCSLYGATGAALACVSGWVISVIGSYLLIRKHVQA